MNSTQLNVGRACSLRRICNPPLRWQRNTSTRTLIIGYGNPLYADDGIGPHAARELGQQGFDTIETHQLTPELADRVAAAHEIYFIDCDARLAPGEVRMTPLEPAPPGPLEHHLTPASLLRLVLDLYDRAPRAIAVGIGPKSCELGAGLSPEAKHAVQTLAMLKTIDRLP
jgi:hydrogenase maturation protease